MSVNLHYEDKARSAGFSSVCGVDEAGAGPLMGPVYAAVILPEGCEIEGLNDSKKMTEKKREALFPVICEKAVAYAIASVDEKEIDATDILSARMKAMQLAIDALQIPADYALIDGNRDHGASAKITTPHETIVGGTARPFPSLRRACWQRSAVTIMWSKCSTRCIPSISSPGTRATAQSSTTRCSISTARAPCTA